MVQKQTKIIPVTYAMGTGGKFLAYLLNSAKIPNYKPSHLSKYGNAHAIYDNDVINMHTLPYTIEVLANEQISITGYNLEQITAIEYSFENPQAVEYISDDVDGYFGLMAVCDTLMQIHSANEAEIAEAKQLFLTPTI